MRKEKSVPPSSAMKICPTFPPPLGSNIHIKSQFFTFLGLLWVPTKRINAISHLFVAFKTKIQRFNYKKVILTGGAKMDDFRWVKSKIPKNPQNFGKLFHLWFLCRPTTTVFPMRWDWIDDGFLGSNEPPLIPPLGSDSRISPGPQKPKTLKIQIQIKIPQIYHSLHIYNYT